MKTAKQINDQQTGTSYVITRNMNIEDLALTDEEIEHITATALTDNPHWQPDAWGLFIIIAKAQRDKILSACYPCEACGGSGEVKRYDQYTDNQICLMECPTCKGTYKGSPMVAALAEDQELPRPFFFNEHYTRALKDITTPKDGTVWKKVKV